jgi:hypothetical protein
MLALLLLAACAAPSGPSWIPVSSLVLHSAPAVATVHFPSGRYFFDREDSSGFYYRAPSGVIKHSFAGSERYDGGVFINRYNPRQLRGYIVWAGGWTKIGDFSREPYTLIR